MALFANLTAADLKKGDIMMFAMGTAHVTLDSTKFWVPIAGEDPEGANLLFSRCEKRYFVSETVNMTRVVLNSQIRVRRGCGGGGAGAGRGAVEACDGGVEDTRDTPA